MVAVLRLGLSRPLRGLIALALVSLATSLVLRGIWGGPWLMDVKGLSRVEAGNQLGAFTIAMIAGPLCIGMIDRKLGRRRELVASTHLIVGFAARLDGARRAALPGLKPVRRHCDAAVLRSGAVRVDRACNFGATAAVRHVPATGRRAIRGQGAGRDQPRLLPRRRAGAVDHRRGGRVRGTARPSFSSWRRRFFQACRSS